MRKDPSDAVIAAQVAGTTIGVIVVAYLISLFTEASSGEQLSAIINGILALVGITTAVILIRQFSQMRKATVAASDAASAAKKSAHASILSLRPWLSCDVEVFDDLTFNAEGHAVLPLQFIVKNVGKTPALGVNEPHLIVTFSGPTHEPSILLLQRLAALNRGLPARAPGAVVVPGGHALLDIPGRVIFPDCEWSERRRLQIQREDLGKACDETTRNFWPELIVLVGYSYHLAEIRADTGRVYRICRVTEDRVVPFFVLGDSVPRSEIRLEPHTAWPAFAT